MTATVAPLDEVSGGPDEIGGRPTCVRRLLRGRPEDRAYVRPLLAALLAATGVLYLWDLNASGWANSFYAAAVQAGTRSWEAFFFGSSDAANFITVDKPPAALWVMEISARLFGLSSWSLLAPQALEGVASVGILYLAVRRAATAEAGLLAGAVLAVTPVAALMFRFDNPDALLALLLTSATYATTRYLDSNRARWLVLGGTLVGVGFLTKSLQAFLVVPVLAAVVLSVSSLPLRRRFRDLILAGAALVVAGGWWVAAVELTPAADRPYIGGSQDNNLFNVIFGYNGFGRLTGHETGSVVAGGAGSAGAWGITGLTRLFNADFGGQISWLLPSALVLLALGLVATARAGRTDRTRAGLLLWGGSLVLTGLVFSLSRGIIHPYYTVALAPAIAAIIGIGAVVGWRRRAEILARVGLAAAVGGAAIWSYVLLDRSPAWHPALRVAILVGGLGAALGIAVLAARVRALRATVAAVALAACLCAPFAVTLDTADSAHTGAIPSAGPTVTAAFAGGGAGRVGGPSTNKGGPGSAGSTPSSRGSIPGSRAGSAPAISASRSPGKAPGGAGLQGGGRRSTFASGGTPGGGLGGLLGSSTPSDALVKLLEADQASYTWVAATTGSENAAAYQLATDDPVMAIGGFNGTDPAPSLAAFERYVEEHKIHYYIDSSVGSSSSDDASRIQAWVEAHFATQTVGGVTVYDLFNDQR